MGGKRGRRGDSSLTILAPFRWDFCSLAPSPAVAAAVVVKRRRDGSLQGSPTVVLAGLQRSCIERCFWLFSFSCLIRHLMVDMP